MLLDRMPAILVATSELNDILILGDSSLDLAIEQALDKTGRRENRMRRLSAKLMMYLVLAMSLYRTLSIPNVFKELLKGLRWLALLRNPPASSALTEARYRLGYEPVKHLFEMRASSVLPPPTFWEYSVHLMDGVRAPVADTPENEQAFGRPKTSRGEAAHPVVRLVTRTAAFSHRVEAVDIDRWDAPETKAVEALMDGLNQSDLVIVDRLYPSGDLFQLFQQKGVPVLARINSKWKPRVVKTLGEGDFIVEVAARRPLEKQPDVGGKRTGRPRKSILVWLRLRMLVYVNGGKEVVRLLTSLPNHIPALEIALLYHERWEIEMTNDEFKNHLAAALHGSEKLCFRSKLPVGVRQEIYGMLTMYDFIRDLIGSAAKTHNLLPLQISFTDALNAIRRILPLLQVATPAQRNVLMGDLYREIALQCRLRPRRARQYPRVVKVKMSDFKCKKRSDKQTKIDHAALTKMVTSAPGLAHAA